VKQLFIFFLFTFSPFLFAKEAPLFEHYKFASIKHLIEQEIGRLVLPQIYQNIGLRIIVDALPGNRAQYVANSGNYAGEIMRIWSYGDENKNTIRVPTPYYYLETMPFIRKSSNIMIHSKADLAEYRLSKVRGVKHTNNITVGLTNIYEMNNSKEMFQLLMNDKVDVVLTNTLDGNVTLKRLSYTEITPMYKPLAIFPLYHYLHKKHHALVPIIDKEIKRLKDNGELALLIKEAEQKLINKIQ
jgi:ABC-type amino acid transport substrate-binding protein